MVGVRKAADDQRKYPFEVLRQYLITYFDGICQMPGRYADGSPVAGHNEWGFSERQALMVLGITERQWRKFSTRGWLTESEADSAAVALGLVPSLLWPSEYAAA